MEASLFFLPARMVFAALLICVTLISLLSMMVLLSFLMLLGAVLGLVGLDTWLVCIAPLFLVTKMQNPGICVSYFLHAVRMDGSPLF